MTLRTYALAVTLALAMATSAFGAGSLEAVRSAARAARDQVSQLRAAQLAQRNELSGLSQRIEQLKAAQKGALTAGSELDVALKHSQELSGVLSGLAQQVSSREVELEAANLALLDALTGELSRLRADFDRQGDRAVRRGLIDQMKKLRVEREALRATLPAAKLPQLDTLKPSDDPEELLEQADLLRDNQEKLQKELKAVEARIAERKQEAELDRRVQRFMGEESMFDDQDRRLRVQRSTTFAGASTTNGAGAPSPSAPVGPDSAGSPSAGTLGAFDTSRGSATPQQGGLDNSGGGVRVISGSDARPQLGGARPVAEGDDDHLEDLEVERLKLRSLADELKQKADELERRANQLK
jgi:hypothetical protein